MKKDYNSVKNQEVKGKFIEREIFANVSSMVEYIIKKGFEDQEAPFTMDDLTNYYIDNSEEIEALEEQKEELEEKIEEMEQKEEEGLNTGNIEQLQKEIEEIDSKIEELQEDQDEPQEVYEWWIVSGWLCNKLKEKGQVVIEHENIWGRCTTGQAILLDHVIDEICDDLGMLVDEE